MVSIKINNSGYLNNLVIDPEMIIQESNKLNILEKANQNLEVINNIQELEKQSQIEDINLNHNEEATTDADKILNTEEVQWKEEHEEEKHPEITTSEGETPDKKVEQIPIIKVNSTPIVENDEEVKTAENLCIGDVLDENLQNIATKARNTMSESTKAHEYAKTLSQSSKGFTESSDYDYLGTSYESPHMTDKRQYQSMYVKREDNMESSGYFTAALPYSEGSACFSVSEPIMGNPVTYLVRGIDNEGCFEISRRYNDFYNFYRTLQIRWPGVYIPPIPPKKVGINKNDDNLKERRIFLEKFIRVLAENDFLIHSEEFKIFSRHNGNIEKVFKVLPILTSESLLKRFQSCLDLTDIPDATRIKHWTSEINEFNAFGKKAQALLKDLKEKFNVFCKTKKILNEHYLSMNQLFNKYEDHNLKEYCQDLHSR